MLSIQKLIDDDIALKNAEPRTGSGKYNPSYLGQCHRKHFWKRKGEQPSNPPDKLALRRFECGHIFEYFATNLIPSAQKQVRLETENFLGYADVVADDEVIDIKSINSKAYWYMDKEGYDVNKEKRHNILQTVFYAIHLQKPKAKLAFISKDDLSIREYGFSAEKWKEDLDKEVGELIRIWKEDKLPDAEPQMGWECGSGKKIFCPYYDKCKAVGGKKWNVK